MSTVKKSTTSIDIPDSEKEMVTLTVDGVETLVEKDSSVYTAIKDMDIVLPAMCYHYSFSPFGSCGLCLVEVEGKKNKVRACTARAEDGMIIRTDTEAMVEARAKAVEKHLVTHPLDCPVCDKDGQCELQDMAYDLGVYDIKKGKRKQIPEDTGSIGLDFNMERCILCGQCINVCKEVQLVDALCFYKKDKKTHVGPHDKGDLFCEFCGDCLAVCPVGAIVSKFSKYTFKPWQLKKTQTTCSFCSDGCQITLETNERTITVVTSELSYTNKLGYDVGPGDSHGGICVRGRFGFQYVQSDKRLNKPLTKVEGEHIEIPWFQALAQIGRRLKEIKTQYGGRAIAGLISGRCTNEAVYLFQRLMRSVLGSNNIDSAARYGHMNSVLAMQHALGIGVSTTNYEQLALSDVILMVGTNLSETNPIATLRIKKAMSEFGGKMIVAETWKTKLIDLATHPLQIHLGSEKIFIQGLVKAIVGEGLCHASFSEKYPAVFKALQNALASHSKEAIAAQCGLPWEKIVEAATLLAESKRGSLVWGASIVSEAGAYDNVLGLIDLALVSGLFEKEGAGVLSVCEENNEQGAVDMGGVPEFLPGQAAYNSESERQRFENAWHASLPGADEPGNGLTLPEMIEAAHRGEIKALYVVGENPLESLPSSMRVREALEKIDLIIVQDPFMNALGKMADYVLPVATFAEKEGSYTNTAGHVQKVNEAFDPRGDVRPDWKVFADLSKQLDHTLVYRSSEEIKNEISKMVPGYYRGKRPPVRTDRYLTHDYISDVSVRYGVLEQSTQGEGSLTLSLKQILYHSGKLTTRDENLMGIYNNRNLQIADADAEALGLESGDVVKLSSDQGSLEIPIEVCSELPKGLVQFPVHFSDPPVKDLLMAEIDPKTHVIYRNSGVVSIESTKPILLDMVSTKPEDAGGAERDHG
ncbi:molybdopterin-dependent oxidoreductase [Nitrospira defluvii]|nr:molybdopterin-dependent oxidoreductase [Nitrospira defluvii]